MPESCEETVTLTGDLHARPAGALSVTAAKFASTIRLTVHPAAGANEADAREPGAREADARSVLAVMRLGASSGQRVTVRAVGPDAKDAVAAVISALADATKAGD